MLEKLQSVLKWLSSARKRTIGVNVQLGFEFNGIDGNPCNGIRFRK